MKAYNYIIVFLHFISCTQNNNEIIITKKVTLEKHIEILSDSTFFSNITCLNIFKHNLYAADIKRNQIFVMDTNMYLINTINQIDETYNKLNNLQYFYVNNDTIVTCDLDNKKYLFQISNQFIKSIKFQDNFSKYNRRFIFKNNNLIISNKGESALLKININDFTQQISFGKQYEFKNSKQKRIRNQRFILDCANTIITISDNLPFIEKYDYTGNLIEKYDYSTIQQLSKDINYTINQKNDTNSYYTLAYDAYTYNNKIYILLASYQGEFHINKIIEFSNMDSIKPTKILQLPDRIYSNICIEDKNIYAFNYIKKNN